MTVTAIHVKERHHLTETMASDGEALDLEGRIALDLLRCLLDTGSGLSQIRLEGLVDNAFHAARVFMTKAKDYSLLVDIPAPEIKELYKELYKGESDEA